MYHEIHEMIRKRKYHIFSGRAKVPFLKKLKIFSSVVTKPQICRMVFAELRARMVAKLDQMLIPLSLLFCVWQLTSVFDMPQATYLQFHLMFTIPQVIVAWRLAKRWAPSAKYFRQGCAWTAVMCLVATVYTTPWDNYLVASGVWGYGGSKGGRVLGTLGHVPVEEYLFFSLETALVSMVWLSTNVVEEPPPSYTAKPWRRLGLSIFAFLFMAGCALVKTSMGFYLGLILVWATPVLALQWAFGADALMAQKRVWRGPLLSVWIYLCIADRWAIRNGIWSLNPDLTLPLLDVLPIEEALFFLVSATMCLWGLVLAMTVTTLDMPLSQSLWKVMLWSNKYHAQPKTTSPFSWVLEQPRPLILTLAALVSVKCMSNIPFTMQMLCLGAASFLFGVQSLCQVSLSDCFQRPEFSSQLVGSSLNEQLKEQLHPDGNFGKASKTQLILMGVLIGQYYTFLWNQSPSVAFNILVCVMIYRFGKADCARDPAARLPVIDVFARGGLLLFAVRWHPSSFAQCFSYLIGGHHASVVSTMSFLKFMETIHLVALVISLVYHGLKCHEGRHVAIIHEICTLIMAFWFLPPATSILLYMAVFYFSMNLEWMWALSVSKAKEQANEKLNLCQKLVVAMALSCMLAIMFDVHAGSHHLTHSLHNSTHKLVNCCFIWLSSATMLHIVYRADYQSWLSEKMNRKK
eukprot:gnl/MRDRNA2_/MRDRNA2_27902_c0_seq1.p1 gnl/MRDRNA2_/MRDRNA2_27902_c0~~gnl/MRDRNA2_/MRDRNA2_27902_c0_seq1.p1  ORF type:complete len:786 (+),score=101.17 gnl/MRDRNA2_/MRDRNA2_27902_c0_seq1:292-2358(+)